MAPLSTADAAPGQLGRLVSGSARNGCPGHRNGCPGRRNSCPGAAGTSARVSPERLSGSRRNTHRVHAFTGTEAISEAYSFEVVVTVRGRDDQEIERTALGSKCTFTWHVGEGPRAFYGVLGAVRVEGARASGDHVRLRMRVVPRLWLLKRKRRTRIFQGMRVPDVVTSVLQEAGISCKPQLLHVYPPREYLTQYEESDYRFVKRILAEAGIFFYFPEGGPVDPAVLAAAAAANAVGSVADTAVSAFAGSAAGALVGDVAAAAASLIPGDTVILGDDALFYPAIGGDSASELAAAGVADMAGEAGAALGLGDAADTALEVGGAVAGAVIAAATATSAPPLHYLTSLETATSLDDKITELTLRSSVRADAATFRDYDPDRPMVRPTSTAVSTAPFPPSPAQIAAGAAYMASAASSALSGVAGSVLGSAAGSALGAVSAVAGAADSLIGQASPAVSLEDYEHHGGYLFPKWPYALEEAGRILRQRRRRAALAHGEGRCPTLAPGHRFALVGHPIEHLDRPYVVTRVEHRGESSAPAGEPWTVYQNAFSCVPAEVTFVPPRPKRPNVLVALTATVVGPPGSEIYVDPVGQIKVQFHWDRAGTFDDKSSCWIRTMHPWGGAGWGVQFIPRIGMEVVVIFEGGDPDKPMVIGAFYNGIHPVPFPLPGNATRSGWRTQSSPGGNGFNELSFEDAAGSEQVYLHAQRNLQEWVGHDHTSRVAHDQSTNVDHDQDLVVGGTSRARIGKSSRVAVGGDHSMTVKGSQTTAVEGVCNLHVGQHHGVMVGSEKKPASADFYSWGTYGVGAKGQLVLSSSQGITLRCGDTKIDITKDGVSIGGKHIALQAGESLSAQGKGPSLVLNDQAQMTAKAIRMFSEKGSLMLDESAHLKGTQVLLNCDGRDPEGADGSSTPAPTKKLHVKLSDPDFEPYAGKSYLLTAGSFSVEGTTGGDGSIDESVPEGVTHVEILLFVGERPDGPKRRYSIALDDTEEAGSPRGLQIRLRNLGYYWGPILDDLDETAVEALKAFQEDHQLSPTGKVDAATKAALDERHGH